ncbi:MAG: autotransporter domain-containing protein [Hyphomicrobiales bacterium]|nr:MAG: autotransporter domain-containing protein [Hyphomicrobiales bacterium]
MSKAYLSRVKFPFKQPQSLAAMRGTTAIAAVLLAMSFTSQAQAQSIIWNDGNGSWTDTSKWTDSTSAHRAPTSADNPTVIQSASSVTLDAATGAAGRLQVLGTGKLIVSGGSVLTTSLLSTIGLAPSLVTSPIVATATDGTGTMTVTGTGSQWNAGTAGVRVGNNAAGTLNVASGGTLSMTGGTLSIGLYNTAGIAGTALGTLNIDAGTVTDSNGGTRVGYNGASGIINITNGGKLSNDGNFSNNVGQSETGSAKVGTGIGTGTVNISGTGSSWTLGSQSSLLVGNGAGASGTVNITNGGLLNFTAPTTLYFGYAGGSGTLVVSGQGSLLSSSGGVSIAGDGVSGTGKATITDGGAITTGAGGSFVVGRGAASTATVDITKGGSVTGSLQVSVGELGGKATVTVDGTGSTLKSNGEVRIGADAGTQGTLTVANGGRVTASFIEVGAAGGTGTLNIGNGGAAGIIDADIKRAGVSSTINFNHNEANYVLTRAINDWTPGVEPAPANGSVNFIGSGMTTLTAVSNYYAATNVNAGELRLAAGASIANSIVTTVNGGRLSGAGALGNLVVNSGGTVAPTGTDTLTTKAVTFNSGSTFLVGINAAGQSGKIAATSATLNGGTVSVVTANGTYVPGTYTLLSTSGAVTGQFSSLSVDRQFAFLTAGLGYTSNAVNLSLTRNAASFASVGITDTQKSVGGALASLPSGNAVYGAVVSQDAAGARKAYDALSGEAYASNSAAQVYTALQVGDTITSHLSEVDGAARGRFVWAKGFGSRGNWGSSGGTGEMSASTGGIMTGVDMVSNGVRFGAAIGYSETNAKVNERGSSLDTDSVHLALYGATRFAGLGLKFGAAYSFNDTSAKRNVQFQGFSENEQGSTSGNALQAFGEVSQRVRVGEVDFEPFAGLTLVNLSNASFTETGGAAALRVAGKDLNVGFTTLGVRPSVMLGQGGGYTFTGHTGIAWRHAFGDVDTRVSTALAGGGTASVSGAPIARDALMLEAGFDAKLSDNVSANIGWTGQVGDQRTDNQIKGGLTVRW